jgi:hypothetical protein
MSYSIPAFFKAISVEPDNASDFQFGPIDDFDERIDELTESFVAFIEGRYAESSEVKLY